MDKLLDNVPCGYITAKDDGEIKHVNKTLLNMLGYENAEEIVGKHIEKILSAGGRIFYHTHVFPLLKLHSKAEEIYLDLKSKQNGLLPVLLNAERLRPDVKDGEALNTYVLIPIRQRSRFEDELLLAKKEAESASLAKDEFLSVVSHELRTPLNAILGWIKVLETNSENPKLLKRGLKIIRSNAKIQTNLIDDILDVSRMVTGKMRLEIDDQTDVTKVIKRSIDTIAPAMTKKKISIVNKARDIPKIAADPERLQQVFWNLLNNAVKFTPSGGIIKISAETKENELVICVSDTGQGIRKEFLPFVFRRFEQHDVAKSRRHGGLGLGLAISQQIIELHGGSIRAMSEGEGKGAEFIFNLPL